jgi:hypothetical protein
MGIQRVFTVNNRIPPIGFTALTGKPPPFGAEHTEKYKLQATRLFFGPFLKDIRTHIGQWPRPMKSHCLRDASHHDSKCIWAIWKKILMVVENCTDLRHTSGFRPAQVQLLRTDPANP